MTPVPLNHRTYAFAPTPVEYRVVAAVAITVMVVTIAWRLRGSLTVGGHSAVGLILLSVGGLLSMGTIQQWAITVALAIGTLGLLGIGLAGVQLLRQTVSTSQTTDGQVSEGPQ